MQTGTLDTEMIQVLLNAVLSEPELAQPTQNQWNKAARASPAAVRRQAGACGPPQMAPAA